MTILYPVPRLGQRPEARSRVLPVPVPEVSTGAPRLILNYATANTNNPQVIPLTGKTTGRDVFVFFQVAATPTLPAPWIEEGSQLSGGGDYYVKLWRLPAASNTALVTNLTINLNGGRSVAAIVWEDDLDTSTSIYFLNNNNAPTASTPALWGTGLHTFTTRESTFAFFYRDVSTILDGGFDLVTYDQSYTDFGDSGQSGSGFPDSYGHVWMAFRANASMTSDGVTATANGAKTFGGGNAGMIAYDAVYVPVVTSANKLVSVA